MDDIIKVENLTKKYNDVLAVDNISFSVKEGSFFAFLGTNGAGKSTTINILCTILQKTGGKVSVSGYDVDKNPFEIKRNIGIVFQNSVLDNALTVRDNLAVRGSFYGLYGKALKNQIEYVANAIDLGDFLDRPYGKLSGGQRRRVDIARALLNSPKVLFLDEPTTGLDPNTRINVWKVVDKLRREHGMTIFLTTHYMEETTDCDSIAIIEKGKIVAEGAPYQLKSEYAKDNLRIIARDSAAVRNMLLGRQFKFEESNNIFKLNISSTMDSLGLVSENADIIQDFEVKKGDMDDVFLSVTGRNLKNV